MSVVVPQWIIGRNVTAFSIAPCTVSASTGVVTVNATQSLSALCEEIALDLENDVENIVPLDVRQDNEVIIGSAARLQLREIMSPSIVLTSIAVGYDYAQVTFTRAGKAWTGLFVIKGYGETIVRGKSMDQITLGPAGNAMTYA